MEPVKVTITDTVTGTVREQVPSDGYLVICGRDRYVASAVSYANGTAVVTIKRVD